MRPHRSDVGRKVRFTHPFLEDWEMTSAVGVIEHVYTDGRGANVRWNGHCFYVQAAFLTPLSITPEEIDQAQREAYADQYL